MDKKAGYILICVFLAIALVFYITAMATPAWFVFEITTNSYYIERIFPKNSFTASTTDKYTLRQEWYIFDVKCCVQEICKTVSPTELSSINKELDMPEQVEILLEGGLAVMFFGLALYMFICAKSADTNTFDVLIPFGVILEIVLIARTSEGNANISTFLKTNHSTSTKFPYSIILSGAGLLFAISACVVRIAIRRKLRHQEMQEPRELQDRQRNVMVGIPIAVISTDLE